MRNFCVFLLLVLLAACGSNPAPVDNSKKTVSTSGGSLSSNGLSLEFPGGAVRKNLEARITSLDKGSSIARFRLEPAGTVLAKPITLSFSGNLPANAVFSWNIGGKSYVFPTTRSGNTLTAQIGRLGYGSAAQVQRLSEDGAALEVGLLDCEFQANQLSHDIAQTDWEKDSERAIVLNDQLLEVVEHCQQLQIQQIQTRVCDAYRSAFSTAQVVAANNYTTFSDLIRPLMDSFALVASAGASCDTSGFDALLEAKFDQFIDFLEAEFTHPSFGDSLTQRDLRTLFHYEATCSLLSLTTPCERFKNSLYPQVLELMRTAAFQECRQGDGALSLSQLLGLGLDFATQGSFFGYAHYSYSDLEADLNYCAAPNLDLRVFDKAATLPEELTKAAKKLQSNPTAPGIFVNNAAVKVPLEGSLRIAGKVQTLVCPNATLSNDALVLRINNVEIARRSTVGNAIDLNSAPFDLLLSRDLPKAGLSDQSKNFVAEIWREGIGCGFSERFKLFTLNVTTLEAFKITSFTGPATIEYGKNARFEWRWSGTPELPVTIKRKVVLCELSFCNFPSQTVVNTLIQNPFETWFCNPNSTTQSARMAVEYTAVDNLGMTTNTVRVGVTCVPPAN